MNRVQFKRLVLGAAITALGSGCAQHSGVLCPQYEAIVPTAQQLYPVPGASAVPDTFGVLVYASTQAVPISLSTGSTSVPTQPVAVPSPLPSPIATPIIPESRAYAVAVPPLAAHTTYGAIALEGLVTGCSPPKATSERIATFTTQ